MSFFQARHAVYVAFAVHIAAAEPPCYLARDPAYNSVRPFMGPARVYDAIKVALSTPQTIAGGDFHHPFGPSLRNVGEMGFCCLPSMMHQGLNDPVLAVESAAFGGAWQYFAGGRFGPLRGRLETCVRVSSGGDWTAFGGPTGVCHDLAVWNDGTGTALFVAGEFDQASGVPLGGLARWNGALWSDVGGGVRSDDGSPAWVRTMVVHKEGSDERLVIGGKFSRVGFGAASVPARNLAVWTGDHWLPIGSGSALPVTALGSWNAADGDRLFVADETGEVREWAGQTWREALGFPRASFHRIHRFATLPFEGRTAAFAAGGRTLPTGERRGAVARFDGVSWVEMGTDVRPFDDDVFAMVATRMTRSAPDGCWVGGAFRRVVGPVPPERTDDAPGSALWAPGSGFWGWNLQSPTQRAATFGVRLAQRATVAGVTSLYLAGDFEHVDSPHWGPAFGVVRIDWPYAPRALGSGLLGRVEALAELDGNLIAAGTITSIRGPVPSPISFVASWDGSRWNPTSGPGANGLPGLPAIVKALQRADMGGSTAVFAALGAPGVHPLYRFDGVRWEPFGPNSGRADGLFATNLGGGPLLYAYGEFPIEGGRAPVVAVGESRWEPIAAGLGGSASCMTIHRFENGEPLLVIGGRGLGGTSGSGAPVVRVVAGEVQPLGDNLDGEAYSLAVFDDGRGPGLFVSGEIVVDGDLTKRHLARWDGGRWTHVASQLLSSPRFMLPDTEANRLLLCGELSFSGWSGPYHTGFAAMRGCPPCFADFDGSGGVDGSDVEAFFIAWEAGEMSADADQNGGIDGADIAAFIRLWDGGTC